MNDSAEIRKLKLAVKELSVLNDIAGKSIPAKEAGSYHKCL